MADRDDDAETDTSDADRAEDAEKTNVDVSDAGSVEPKDACRTAHGRRHADWRPTVLPCTVLSAAAGLLVG